ncbi:DUF2812 domain-containing protein [Marinilactibacillus sp. GCM10026970]|uniref:DUF2812 domain-containing protein n=1 Tax=Marinilactibacillus sp. GCM10026970 TaxID=3252642 RepID=UPI00361240EC
MIKYNIFIDLTKEENWLREMSTKGYAFQKKKLGYNFKKERTLETIYRIDYRTFNRREDFLDYIALFEDSGWIHLSGTKSSGKQYFKKDETKDDLEGELDIFSDQQSKALRYKRTMQYLSYSFITLLFTSIVLFDSSNIEASLNPKSLYYTPGLWQQEGVSFWFSFLFETPFALARGFMWYFFPLALIVNGYLYIKSREQWKDCRIFDSKKP